jgi:hypothetical protein
LATAKNKNIGIVGTRRRNSGKDHYIVEKKFFEIYEDGDWIVSGGCGKGADRFAESIAKHFGIPILIFYPRWKIYGKSAGFRRNDSIAHYSDILIACVAEDRKGGTEDTLTKHEKFHPKAERILV